MTTPTAAARSEPLRRGLAFAEGALLVFPLLALWPFGLAVLLVENFSRVTYLLVGLPVMLLSAAALVALLRLLKAFVVSRGAGLRRAPKMWWVVAGIGGALVVLGCAVRALEQSETLAQGPHSPIGISVLGLPAMLPLLHMALEFRAAASHE